MTAGHKRRLAIVLAGAVPGLVVLAGAGPAGAHPLGDFSINTYAGLQISADTVAVDYVVDLAEIPTLQSGFDADGDGTFDRGELDDFAAEICAQAADGLSVTVGGTAAPAARVVHGSATTAAGTGGLPTTRVECRLLADAVPDADGESFEVNVVDGFSRGKLGWHELTAVGDGTTVVTADVPAVSASGRLTDYPDDAPVLSRHDAALTVRLGGPRLTNGVVGRPEPVFDTVLPGFDRVTASVAGLGERELTLWFGLTAVMGAVVLGTMHAVAPGHGKTVMAAYLVARQGTVRQALALGASVTITHTAGVLVLGTLIAVSSLTAPERVYPWLGMISGLFVAAIGLNLLRRSIRIRRAGGWLTITRTGVGHHHHGPPVLGPEVLNRSPLPVAASTVEVHREAGPPAGATAGHGHGHHDHGHHDHGHSHGHHDHGHHDHGHHDHGHHDRGHHDHGRVGWRSLVAMGFAGGMVPSPSALVVLLAAVALGRTWFGVALVVAYGLGMALTLLVAGLVLVLVRDGAQRLLASDRAGRLSLGLTWLPSFTAVLVVAGGLLISARAVTSL